MKAFATKVAHYFDETAGHFLGTSSRYSSDFIIAGRWDYFFASPGTHPRRFLDYSFAATSSSTFSRTSPIGLLGLPCIDETSSRSTNKCFCSVEGSKASNQQEEKICYSLKSIKPNTWYTVCIPNSCLALIKYSLWVVN